MSCTDHRLDWPLLLSNFAPGLPLIRLQGTYKLEAMPITMLLSDPWPQVVLSSFVKHLLAKYQNQSCQQCCCLCKFAWNPPDSWKEPTRLWMSGAHAEVQRPSSDNNISDRNIKSATLAATIDNDSDQCQWESLSFHLHGWPFTTHASGNWVDGKSSMSKLLCGGDEPYYYNSTHKIT